LAETRLAVRLTPRGGSDRIDGWGEDASGRPLLKVRVSAPPVEGEANAALEKLLAKALGLPKSAVTVAAGQTARIKQLEIRGLTLEEVRARLAG
jgi:uncharacterized protein YggU (UPF0235/DUF167 family)